MHKEIALKMIGDKYVTNIEAYTACRLIPLDKNPGACPIDVGEVLHRITGKFILSVVKQDVMKAAGNLHLCVALRVPRKTGKSNSNSFVNIGFFLDLITNKSIHHIPILTIGLFKKIRNWIFHVSNSFIAK